MIQVSIAELLAFHDGKGTHADYGVSVRLGDLRQLVARLAIADAESVRIRAEHEAMCLKLNACAHRHQLGEGGEDLADVVIGEVDRIKTGGMTK